MNLQQLNSIGSGAYFPIQLITFLGSDNKPQQVPKMVPDTYTDETTGETIQKVDKDDNLMYKPEYNEDGTMVMVDKIGWYMLYGDIKLIKQNIIAILTYQIGQRFRQEYFGSRTWECIEEPNTQVLAFLVRDFIKTGISNWEPRIKALDTFVQRESDKLYIKLHFMVDNSKSVEELNFQYTI